MPMSTRTSFSLHFLLNLSDFISHDPGEDRERGDQTKGCGGGPAEEKGGDRNEQIDVVIEFVVVAPLSCIGSMRSGPRDEIGRS